MHYVVLVVLAVGLIACERAGRSQSEAMESEAAGRSAAEITRAAADNTSINERDREPGSLTPGDQGDSEADRTVTQRVRQAVMRQDSLSMTAQNVKIITINGVVTLRGPVKDEQERSTIARLARDVAGVKRVDNQLEVAGTSN
jgi:osmotically-inducible protein OsmY